MNSRSGQPHTETERRVAALWKEVLRVPEVNANDDFFALGGNSMTMVKLLNRVCQDFALQDALEELVLEVTTVAALAAKIDVLSPSSSSGP